MLRSGKSKLKEAKPRNIVEVVLRLRGQKLENLRKAMYSMGVDAVLWPKIAECFEPETGKLLVPDECLVSPEQRVALIDALCVEIMDATDVGSRCGIAVYRQVASRLVDSLIVGFSVWLTESVAEPGRVLDGPDED